MADACNSFITDPFEFPRRSANRPGLPRIGYRIGAYPEFVEAMLRDINAAPPLAAWTHRGADDPAIALVAGAAVLGDILTFYQEHYANEAFLRTALWRESVADLVRLIGYRLSPGIGGRATFAFEAKGAAPVTIRAGFPVKAELAGLPAPAEFQTDAELVAQPHLSKFNFYRARSYATGIAGGVSQFEIAAVGGATDALTLDAVDLKKGDRLVVIPEENFFALLALAMLGWTVGPPEQVVVVDKVERVLGRAIVTIEGALAHAWYSECRAHRLGRTFRHFGAGAPLNYVETDTSSDPPTTTSAPTAFGRALNATTANGAAYTSFDASVFPIDQEVGDLALGSTVVVTGFGFGGILAIARRAKSLRPAVPRWGNLSAPATLVTLDAALAPAWGWFGAPTADIRDLRLHETKGRMLTLKPLASFATGGFTSGANALRYYGTAAQARALAGRWLFFQHADGRSTEAVCVNEPDNFPLPTSDIDPPKMWPVSFDRAPAPFAKADFDELAPTITVYGNLVDATQGKQEREAVLGNGDGRLAFQTFPLPKAPLTYFNSAATIPPETPELEVYVAGRLWTRVDSFFGHAPDEEIYIVREDADGKSYVQFGDGITGARLPSGLKIVTARYRTGSGAFGAGKPGTTPTAGERIDGLDKVRLAGIVSGGAAPEAADKAREAAPGKIQSLGRLVSLRDFETEVLAIPGVVKTAAAWDLHEGVPALVLRVLLEAGRESEFAAVRDIIAHYQRCRGPDRFPVIVQQAFLRYLFLDVTYAFEPRLKREDVEAGLRAALGLVGDDANARTGLFGLHRRRLGEPEYPSRIEGTLQNVAGIVWCRVTALGLFGVVVSDPATIVLPGSPRPLAPYLAGAPLHVYQLYGGHLTLIPAAEPAAGECE